MKGGGGGGGGWGGLAKEGKKCVFKNAILSYILILEDGVLDKQIKCMDEQQ